MPAVYDFSLGNVRASQTLYNCGPGSIINLRYGSFMPMGLEFQEIRFKCIGSDKDEFKKREERLEKMLGVEYFLAPPTPGEDQIVDFGNKVNRCWAFPVVRFPEWLECPTCHRLGMENKPFELKPDGRVFCAACNRVVNPVRFIIICPNGHIQDFPWLEYAHRNIAGWKGRETHSLFLKSAGKSAALSDLYLECKECLGPKEDLGDIFMQEKMKDLDLRCKGYKPWLGTGKRERCASAKLLRPSQRGGSSVYFPVMASMISIPPASDAVAEYLRGSYPLLAGMEENQRRIVLEGFCKEKSIPVSIALNWFDSYHAQQTGQVVRKEANARFEEYNALSINHLEEPVGGIYPEFQTKTVVPTYAMQKWFDVFTSVERLREVRSLCGFTRVEPKTLHAERIGEAIIRRDISPLSDKPMLWLPGIEIRGEGIFLRFDQNKLGKWLDNSPELVKRADRINSIYEYFSTHKYGTERHYTITPQLLMIHSFAHAIIRRLSLDCGYSAASLRERLYISEPGEENQMAGVLIYTGSSDSDGSLGGLIHMATPDSLEVIVSGAIEDAGWCASDPVCAETDPKLFSERLSGASCHACLLLPETSCERYNKELDRVMLVGTPDGKTKGFFTTYYNQI